MIASLGYWELVLRRLEKTSILLRYGVSGFSEFERGFLSTVAM